MAKKINQRLTQKDSSGSDPGVATSSKHDAKKTTTKARKRPAKNKMSTPASGDSKPGFPVVVTHPHPGHTGLLPELLEEILLAMEDVTERYTK